MADKIYLETTDLENIASGLKTKGNSIKEEYTTNCYSALKMGNSCLEVTGLNIDKFFESLNTIYTNISDRCNSLANFITNNVIPNYDQVSKVITDNFDNELGKELAAIMGLTATTNNSSSSGSRKPQPAPRQPLPAPPLPDPPTPTPQATSITQQGYDASTSKLGAANANQNAAAKRALSEKIEKVETTSKTQQGYNTSGYNTSVSYNANRITVSGGKIDYSGGRK